MTWEEFVAACLPESHTVLVEALTGAGPDGDVYADAVSVPLCYVEQRQRRVRAATQDVSGSEVIGSTTVYGPASITATVGAMVTDPWGDRRKVLSVARRSAAGLALPEHTELVLE